MSDESRVTILIVDDDPKLRFVLGTQLRGAGYRVCEAGNGSEAVAIAAECAPDVVIMDLKMPGMDGIAATRAIKADPKTADVPIIILTGTAGTDDLVRAMDAGAQDYVHKPFDASEIQARVRTAHGLALARKNLDQANTRLERQVDAQTEQLQHLYQFMRDLSRAATTDEILDLVIECVRKTTGARRISLLMTDATGENLVCERAVGIDPEVVRTISIKAMEGITGQVFTRGVTLAATARDGKDEPRYGRDAFLSTPLVSTSLETQEGVLGVLNVTEKNDDTPFSESEIECIRSIADAAAIAIDGLTKRDRLHKSVSVLLQTVGFLAEYRDEETTLHLKRVSKLARILATELSRSGPYADQINQEFIDSLVQAAPMHDIGKVGIPDEILTKPGKLTDEEFQIMKTHTEIGRRVLSQALDPKCPVPLLEMCISIAHSHHERFDGQGYPKRIKGHEIPLAARIIALVDAYDAITSRRRYKDASTHDQAVDIIRRERGAHFDPVIVDAFLRRHGQFDAVRRPLTEDQCETAQTPLQRVASAS